MFTFFQLRTNTIKNDINIISHNNSEMIIPVRCFTCGKVLADVWEYYDEEVKKMTSEEKENGGVQRLFEHLNLKRICCRRHLLGHVDLVEKI